MDPKPINASGRNTRLLAMIHAANGIVITSAGIRALAFDCDAVTGQMCDVLAKTCADLSNQLVAEMQRETNDGARVQKPTPSEIKIVKG